MSTHAATLAATPVPRRGVGRMRAAAGAAAAAVLGAAPHVLHHAGPLAGAALFAGASGNLLFAAVGLLASVPMLRRLRHRTGSWRAPASVLALMALVFTLSSLVVGPALTSGGERASSTTPDTPASTAPIPAGHESHHR